MNSALDWMDWGRESPSYSFVRLIDGTHQIDNNAGVINVPRITAQVMFVARRTCDKTREERHT